MSRLSAEQIATAGCEDAGLLAYNPRSNPVPENFATGPVQHDVTHDPGLRSHAVAAQGLRVLERLERAGAEPTAPCLFRASGGKRSLKKGSDQPLLRPMPTFATGPATETTWENTF